MRGEARDRGGMTPTDDRDGAVELRVTGVQ
jgi:hypothetical protein